VAYHVDSDTLVGFHFASVSLCVCVCVCMSAHAVPPHINNSHIVDERSVVVGKSAELHCQASGVPQPAVHWIRDGQLITFVDHPNLRVDNAGQTLRLHNMQLIDIGAYTCVAGSVAGNTSKQFILSILGQFMSLSLLLNCRRCPRCTDGTGSTFNVKFDTSGNAFCKLTSFL